MPSHRLRVLLTSSLAVLVACKGPRGTGGTTIRADEVPQATTAAATSASLGPGDLIEVRVFEEADLSGPYRVAPGGTIDFPLCGKVPVQGLNSSATADTLTRCLGEKYLKHPQVTVLLREYNSKKIFVLSLIHI